MEVILIETEAFYRLMYQVIERISEPEKERWISEKETMQLLGIKSKTTLWKMRSQGKIRYSQPSKKVILYDRQSIDNFLDQNAFEIF